MSFVCHLHGEWLTWRVFQRDAKVEYSHRYLFIFFWIRASRESVAIIGDGELLDSGLRCCF